ncbi:MAG: hypothetical protein MO846_05285 [Candidatus Devosia symbiotica]|nr:hypothetical protein [Candidatus Devosia symbiotica]
MPLSTSSIIFQLNELIGTNAVIGQADQIGPYLHEPRRRFHTGAAAVTLPNSVEPVQAIICWANANAVASFRQVAILV